MDHLASQTIDTIDDICMCVKEIENQGGLSVTMSNQIKSFKFELRYARESLFGDYPSLHKPVRNWVNLVERNFYQPIKNGRIPADILGETMSSLLLAIDDCETIDNIYKYLDELEKGSDLNVHVRNHIQNLKFELRNLRIHFKWQTFYNFPVSCEVRARVKDVEQGLLQPGREGSKSYYHHLEETFSILLPSMKLKKNVENSALWFHAQHKWDPSGFTSASFDFAYADATTDEVVVEWIDPLLENLKHLIQWNDILVDFPKDQFEALVEKLIFLRNFLDITGKELEEVIKNATPMQVLLHKRPEDLLIRIKWLVQNAMYVSLLSWADGDNRWIKYFLVCLAKLNRIEPEIRVISVQFLKTSKTANQGILGIDLQALATVDSLLDELLKGKGIDSFMGLDVHELEFLHHELNFLKYFLMDVNMKQQSENETQNFNSLLIQLETIAGELRASLTQTLFVGEREDHMADEMNILYHDLLRILNLLKNEIRQMYLRVPKPSMSTFPWTSRLDFLNFFMQNLEDLLKYRADSITYVKKEIEILQNDLAFLTSFIGDVTKNLAKDDSFTSSIMEVAYEAERVIDLISASRFPKWYFMLWLSEVTEKMKTLRKDCTEVHSKKCNSIVLKMEKISINDSPQAFRLAAEEELVGFQDETEKLIDQLTRGLGKLEIISIVGMPGLGKTTLAKKVYKHPSVSMYFHVQSWYCISQVYNRHDLLVSILGNVTNGIREMDDEDMAQLISRSLRGRRYLIVLDDIWSIEPWIDICSSFPDDCTGSRILFTSRIREVALQANPTNVPLDLRLLSDEESWELLEKKVFHGHKCPPKLHTIGKKIAENCKGLPLSVVLIAGVLTKLEEIEDHWKQVSESLGKLVIGDMSKYMIELSYNHLPSYLKSCFLYFGAFPEDKEIQTWKLKRLWIAEGLVQSTKSESIEDVAEGYLMDLISRSLVLITKIKSNGGVKSCCLHDLLHEFSMDKAKDKNFALISKELCYDSEKYKQSYYFGDSSLCGWMPCDSYVRSLVLHPILNRNSWDKNFFPSVVFNSLKLLRVLDLQQITLASGDFHTVTELLVHLRYFACSIQGELNHVQLSVGNLWRLETLLVKTMNEMEMAVKLPEILLQMPYLKHVSISDEAAFEFSDTFPPEKSNESGIEKFSTLLLYLDNDTTEMIIRRLKCLRKLKCIFLESMDQRKSSNIQFPTLDLLNELESLNVTYRSRKLPRDFSFPSNLKKLTLSWFGLPWSEISKIGRLPHLNVLKLLHSAFKGEIWDVSDDEFVNLKFLKLEWLDIVEWNATPYAFPRLEHLLLKRCMKLKEIPSSFGESNTLQTIEVKWCKNSVIESVCKIEEEQQERGASDFKVFIQNQESNSSSCARFPCKYSNMSLP